MRSQILLCAAAAAGAFAQSTTTLATSAAGTTATATVLIGTITGGLAGSIVSADGCATTYAFSCTDSAECGAAPSFSVTEGPTMYMFSYSTSTAGAKGTYAESCSLSGSSYAVCAATLSLSAQGTSTKTSTSTTLTGSQLHYGQFAITAGAEKLVRAGSCTQSGNAAAPTGVLEVYKVLVVPAAAAMVAAGALL
ncbi:hypothetical protein LTR53_016496 [Teratosphaeriaceae sp. CCFEE 6253]|nr:hypothetical protein LTR53_016496 [Teratosphaeriaceae sp. CCFEE 6253]